MACLARVSIRSMRSISPGCLSFEKAANSDVAVIALKLDRLASASLISRPVCGSTLLIVHESRWGFAPLGKQLVFSLCLRKQQEPHTLLMKCVGLRCRAGGAKARTHNSLWK